MINIPDIDLSGYGALKFSVRLKDAGEHKLGVLKVGVMNKRKEFSSLYVPEINNRWKRIILPFSEFNQIRSWSDVAQLSFTLEEWNSYKNGNFAVSAAPIDATELARNNFYVFALPPRWDFDYSEGYVEAENILKTSPLKAFDILQ